MGCLGVRRENGYTLARLIDTESTMKQYDVMIAGGGMVGAALACGLAMQGKRVAVIEPKPPVEFDPSSEPDLRLSAFSLGSEQLLRQLGAWEGIESMRLTPYSGLHTWEVGMTDHVEFEAKSLGLDHLGYMIENRVVQLALWQRCQHLDVSFYPWSQWQILKQDEQWVTIKGDEQTLQARLFIGADGARSQTRQQAGIGISGWNYRQRCFSINVKLNQSVPPVTWQEFHPQGPRAFLPLAAPYGTFIWYDKAELILKLQQFSKEQLKAAIVARFPSLAGDFEVLNFASFPLTRQHANHYYQGRIVLAGDAAHTIHPLAGQGVNLGFKDVAKLLKVLEHEELSTSLDSALRRYTIARKADNLLMQSTMDLIYKSFSHPNPVVGALRRLGLMAAQHSGVIKKEALRYALGVSPTLSRK